MEIVDLINQAEIAGVLGKTDAEKIAIMESALTVYKYKFLNEKIDSKGPDNSNFLIVVAANALSIMKQHFPDSESITRILADIQEKTNFEESYEKVDKADDKIEKQISEEKTDEKTSDSPSKKEEEPEKKEVDSSWLIKNVLGTMSSKKLAFKKLTYEELDATIAEFKLYQFLEIIKKTKEVINKKLPPNFFSANKLLDEKIAFIGEYEPKDESLKVDDIRIFDGILLSSLVKKGYTYKTKDDKTGDPDKLLRKLDKFMIYNEESGNILAIFVVLSS